MLRTGICAALHTEVYECLWGFLNTGRSQFFQYKRWQQVAISAAGKALNAHQGAPSHWSAQGLSVHGIHGVPSHSSN